MTAVAALAVGMGGTAKSESAPWPGGRVAALWPTFAAVPGRESGDAAARSWNGVFAGCAESGRVQLDYRCDYRDAAGQLGYVCVTAGSPLRDLSSASVTAVVAPSDPTYRAAAPGQVCFASLAYVLSIG